MLIVLSTANLKGQMKNKSIIPLLFSLIFITVTLVVKKKKKKKEKINPCVQKFVTDTVILCCVKQSEANFCQKWHYQIKGKGKKKPKP